MQQIRFGKFYTCQAPASHSRIVLAFRNLYTVCRPRTCIKQHTWGLLKVAPVCRLAAAGAPCAVLLLLLLLWTAPAAALPIGDMEACEAKCDAYVLDYSELLNGDYPGVACGASGVLYSSLCFMVCPGDDVVLELPPLAGTRERTPEAQFVCEAQCGLCSRLKISSLQRAFECGQQLSGLCAFDHVLGGRDVRDASGGGDAAAWDDSGGEDVAGSDAGGDVVSGLDVAAWDEYAIQEITRAEKNEYQEVRQERLEALRGINTSGGALPANWESDLTRGTWSQPVASDAGAAGHSAGDAEEAVAPVGSIVSQSHTPRVGDAHAEEDGSQGAHRARRWAL